MSILESDYEHEFLLALRLMENVLSKLQLDKADCQERILKVKTLAKWNSFPGVHALVLKVKSPHFNHDNPLVDRIRALTGLHICQHIRAYVASTQQFHWRL